MYRDIKRDLEAGTLTIREYSLYGELKGSLTITEESAAQILAGKTPPGYRVHEAGVGRVMIAARDGSGLVMVALEALRLALNLEAQEVD